MQCLDLEGNKLYGGASTLNSEGKLRGLYINILECDPTKLNPGEECKSREEQAAYLKSFPGLSITFYTNTQTFDEAEFQENPILSHRDFSWHRVSSTNP